MSGGVKFILPILAYIGFSIVSVAGIHLALQTVIDAVKDGYAGLPADVLQYLQLAGIPKCISIVCTAYLVSALISGTKRVRFGAAA